MDLKTPWVTYVGMAIAIFAIVTNVFGWVPAEIAWGVAGIFGFGSIASLRGYIESKGWKTYVITGIPAILGVLTVFKVIDLETYQQLMVAFGPLTAMTLQQAVTKAKLQVVE